MRVPANLNTPGQILPFTVGGVDMLSEHDHGRTDGESFAGFEPCLHAGGQQGQVSLCGESVLDQLDHAEQLDLGVQYSVERDVTGDSGPTEQSLSCWGRTCMHGGRSLEPVSVYVEWRRNGNRKGFVRAVRPAFELNQRVAIYGSRTGDMPCSKRKRRLAGRTAAGEPGQGCRYES